MNIFFDLDGTLIDSKQRLFRLFNFLVPDSKLSFEAYWNFKKNGIGHEQILQHQFKYPHLQIEAFQIEWLRLIEDEKWLLYDMPFADVTEKLIQLSKLAHLHLVTARQMPEMVNTQIKKFGWQNIFKNVLVTKQQIEKHLLVLKYVKPNNEDWFIGDTGKDIQAGKLLNINTVAVLSGFRSKQQLEKYKPNCILDFVTNFNPNKTVL